MPFFSGDLTDAAEKSISELRPRMLWILNRTTVHGSTVIVSHPVEATINGQTWSINLAPTDVGEWYRVELQYFDPDPDSNRLMWVQELWRNVEITDTGPDFAGTGGGWATPDTTAVQTEEPAPPTPWWLDAQIGDPDPGTSTGSGDFYKWED